MIDLWGDDIPEEEPEEEIKETTFFEFFDDITNRQSNIMSVLSEEEQRRNYSPYHMNQALSQSADSIMYVNCLLYTSDAADE